MVVLDKDLKTLVEEQIDIQARKEANLQREDSDVPALLMATMKEQLQEQQVRSKVPMQLPTIDTRVYPRGKNPSRGKSRL